MPPAMPSLSPAGGITAARRRSSPPTRSRGGRPGPSLDRRQTKRILPIEFEGIATVGLSLVASLGVCAATPIEPGDRAEADLGAAPPFKISAWTVTTAVRTGGGYKDNVLLGTYLPQPSAFASAGLDLFVMRLPWDGTEVSFMLTGDDRHYFSVSAANEEATVLAEAQIRHTYASGWVLGASAQYFFINQVFDTSASEAEVGVVLARGESVGLRPTLSRSLGQSTWLDLEIPGTRQWLDQPLDSYWEVGPRLRLRHEYKAGAEVYASYAANERPYDTREQASPSGIALPGTHLQFGWQQLETGWKHYWDRSRQWRSVTRGGFEVNQDNGTGYYDYRKYFVSEQLRFRSGHWELQAQGGVNYYRYPLQAVSIVDPTTREKTLVNASARVACSVARRLKVVAEYEYEQSLSNEKSDAYRVTTAQAGLEWEF